MGMVAPTFYTAAMVRAMPEDGKRYGVIDGELLVTPAPGWPHQRALRDLLLLLHPYVRQHRLGEALLAPADIELDARTLVQPDLFVVRDTLTEDGRTVALAAGNLAALTAGPKQIRVGTTDALLVRDGDAVIAFDLKCTHAGCTVAWQEAEHIFHCPCHGGVYDARGVVKDGPPPLPLRRLHVSVDERGEISVTSVI